MRTPWSLRIATRAACEWPSLIAWRITVVSACTVLVVMNRSIVGMVAVKQVLRPSGKRAPLKARGVRAKESDMPKAKKIDWAVERLLPDEGFDRVRLYRQGAFIEFALVVFGRRLLVSVRR